jgi:hypothetical protein
LLNHVFSSLVNRLENDFNLNEKNPLASKRKSDLSEVETDYHKELIKKGKQSTEYEKFETVSKLFKNVGLVEQEKNIDINCLNILWKFDTLKCVDATPLVVSKKSYNFPSILIGSHSKQFICVNGLNGTLIWNFFAQDRIESSACVSKCGNFVIFG